MATSLTRLGAAFIVVLLGAAVAAAYSGPAHQAIGEAAQDQLTPAAQAALARILQDTDTLAPGSLAGVATWPDDLRARLRHGVDAPGPALRVCRQGTHPSQRTGTAPAPTRLL
jgi:hypothetical protein